MHPLPGVPRLWDAERDAERVPRTPSRRCVASSISRWRSMRSSSLGPLRPVRTAWSFYRRRSSSWTNESVETPGNFWWLKLGGTGWVSPGLGFSCHRILGIPIGWLGVSHVFFCSKFFPGCSIMFDQILAAKSKFFEDDQPLTSGSVGWW